MEKYFVFEDGKLIASTADREQAVKLIRAYQATQTHPFLKAEYSIIKGRQEFISYK